MILFPTLTMSWRGPAMAVALAAAVASPAHANSHRNPITLTSAPGMTGSFVDPYPLMPSISTGIDYFTSRIDVRPSFSITSFMATLFSESTSLPTGVNGNVGALIPNSFFLGSLAPIAYQLGIGGLAFGPSGADSYSGLLRVTASVAPTPEPKIWAMLLVGVGLVCLRLRRKSRLDRARHFA